jgi:hypothetical protein
VRAFMYGTVRTHIVEHERPYGPSDQNPLNANPGPTDVAVCYGNIENRLQYSKGDMSIPNCSFRYSTILYSFTSVLIRTIVLLAGEGSKCCQLWSVIMLLCHR